MYLNVILLAAFVSMGLACHKSMEVAARSSNCSILVGNEKAVVPEIQAAPSSSPDAVDKCPGCGSLLRVRPVIYGFPPPFPMRDAVYSAVRVGKEREVWACAQCGKRFADIPESLRLSMREVQKTRLRSGTRLERLDAAVYIGWFAPLDRNSVDTLISCLAENDWDLRVRVICSLASSGEEAYRAEAAVTQLLNDQNQTVRAAARAFLDLLEKQSNSAS